MEKKEWIIKCGGAEAYLTEIIPEQLGQDRKSVV